MANGFNSPELLQRWSLTTHKGVHQTLVIDQSKSSYALLIKGTAFQWNPRSASQPAQTMPSVSRMQGRFPGGSASFAKKNKETISNSRKKNTVSTLFLFFCMLKSGWSGLFFSFFFYRRLHNETGSNPLPIWKFFRLSATCEILWWPLTSLNWFVLCDLRIVSGTVYHPEQPHAQSLFLFPIVFGNNLITFFDGTKDNEAVHSIVYTTSLW